MEIIDLDVAGVHEHADELAQLLLDAHASGMALGLAAPLTQDRAVAEWLSLAERADVLLAAVEDGALIGAGSVSRAKADNGRHRGEVQRLAVRGDRRGGGIGGALLDELVERALLTGMSLLWLTTHADTLSDAFYVRRGWTRVGIVPGWAERPDGALVANAFFYRELRGTGAP